MGRVLRWFKDLLGFRKHRPDPPLPDDPPRPAVASSSNNPPYLSPAEAAWLRSFYSASGDHHDPVLFERAFAVAAATAAAADAARAAAQAAAAVVRLTGGGCGRKRLAAAVRIQAVFRGYLARKALRALKALVKLQALARGYLVRKQAAAALRSMQAMLRAQASLHSLRGRGAMADRDSRCRCDAPRLLERFDEGRSEQTASSSFPSRRLSSCLDSPQSDVVVTTDASPKIVEVDMGCRGTNDEVARHRPKSRCGQPDNRLEAFNSILQSSPFPMGMIATRVPRAPGTSLEWGPTEDECRFSTAASTPKLLSSYNDVPVTPSRVCGGLGDGDVPTRRGYMASTESFSAKSRSRSAPRQRPGGRRSTLNELMESRSSFSGVRMQRSCTRAQEVINFKDAIARKLRSSDGTSRDVGRGEATTL